MVNINDNTELLEENLDWGGKAIKIDALPTNDCDEMICNLRDIRLKTTGAINNIV